MIRKLNEQKENFFWEVEYSINKLNAKYIKKQTVSFTASVHEQNPQWCPCPVASTSAELYLSQYTIKPTIRPM